MMRRGDWVAPATAESQPFTNSGDPEGATRGRPLFHKILSLTPNSLTSSGRVRESVLEETVERKLLPSLRTLERWPACCQAADLVSASAVAVSPLQIVVPRGAVPRDIESRGTPSARSRRRSIVGAGPIGIDRGTAEILEPSPRRDSAPIGGSGQRRAQTSSRDRSGMSDLSPRGPRETRHFVSHDVFALTAALQISQCGAYSHLSASGCENRADPRPLIGRRPSELPSGLPRSAARIAARKARHAKRNADECPPTGGKPDRHR